jgi:hypothetical protein
MGKFKPDPDTQARYQRVIDLWNSGATAAEIMSQENYKTPASVHTTIGRLRRQGRPVNRKMLSNGAVKQGLAGPLDPFVRQLFELILREETNLFAISKKSGVDYTSLRGWGLEGVQPTIGNLEAVLNTLGYRLTIVPMEENDARERSKSNNLEDNQPRELRESAG